MATVGDLQFRFSARGADDVSRAANKAKSSLNSVERAQKDLASTSTTASTAVQGTASNLSFELVQASQDAKFGMAGVANQLPLIQQQFARLTSRAGGLTGAMKAIGSSLAGPAGVVAGITLLLTFKDDIVSFFKSFMGGAEKAKKATEDFKKSVRSNAEALFDSLREEPAKAEKAISLLEGAIQRTQQRLGEAFTQGATDSIKEISKELNSLRSALATVEARSSKTEGQFVALTELGIPPQVAQRIIDIANASSKGAEETEEFASKIDEILSKTVDVGRKAEGAGVQPFPVESGREFLRFTSVLQLRLQALQKQFGQGLRRTMVGTLRAASRTIAGFVAGLESAASAGEALKKIMQRALQAIIDQLIRTIAKTIALKVIASIGSGGTSLIAPSQLGFGSTPAGQALLGKSASLQASKSRQVGGQIVTDVEVIHSGNQEGARRNKRTGRRF